MKFFRRLESIKAVTFDLDDKVNLNTIRVTTLGEDVK